MDQEQLRKALVELPELEYLFDHQWVPAIIKQSTNRHFLTSGSHSQNVTIQLLSYPSNHSGIIHLSEDDIEHRLRVKSSN